MMALLLFIALAFTPLFARSQDRCVVASNEVAFLTNSTFRVPHQFWVMNSLVTVVIDSAECDTRAWATYEHRLRRIVISNAGNPPAWVLRHSFFHEFAHSAFEHCRRNDLSKDEQLVEMLAVIIEKFILENASR